MAKDALGAHARDELGISEITTARPVQAALTSAATFAVGAAMPLLAALVSPARLIIPVVTTASLVFLAVLGAVGARAGGANVWRARRARRRSGAPSPWRSRPASAPWSAHRSSSAPELPRHMTARSSSTDAVFEKFAHGVQPGCAVGVIQSGELVHAAGYGFADIERGVRIDADTVFNIASTSKQFTAFALLLLARDGRLALDDCVRKFVPELPPLRRCRDAAPAHAPHRRSQKLCRAPIAGGPHVRRTHDARGRASGDRTPARSPTMIPGNAFAYSNTGYFLMSLIIERVSGHR